MAIIAAIILFFFSVLPVHAQTLQDLSHLQDQYKSDCSLQLTKQQIDKQYNTINSNREYIDSTKVCLTSRNKMIGTYLAILENNLNKYKPINPDQTTNLQSTLHQWATSFQDQNQNIINFQTKNEITNYATDFQKKYETIQKDIAKSIAQSESNRYGQIKNELYLIAATNPKILSDLSSRFDNTTNYFQKIDTIIQDQDSRSTIGISSEAKYNLDNIKNEIINIRNTIVFYYAN